jgi:uncharacterized membrane protein
MAWVIAGSRSAHGRPRFRSRTARTPSSIIAAPATIACAAIAAVSLLIAGAFALAGAWLVLPFAGLEIAALVWAVRRVARGPVARVTAPVPGCLRRVAASRIPNSNSISVIKQRRKLS